MEVQVWSTAAEQVDTVVPVEIAGEKYLVVATSLLEGNDWSSTIRLLRHANGSFEHVHGLRLPTTVGSMAWFEPDVIVCAGDDGDLYYCMFDTETSTWRRLEPETAHGHNELISSVAVNSAMLASGSWDATVKLWDLTNMALLEQFKEHTDKVWGVQWAPLATTQLATASQDRSVRLWDTRQPGAVMTITTPAAAMCVAWHPTQEHLLTAGLEDGSIWTIDSRSLETTLSTLNQVHRGSVHALAYEGDALAAASDDTTVTVWDDLSLAAPTQRLVYEEHADYVRGVAWWSPTHLVSSSYDKSVHMWQVA
ncbi:methylosome protein 50 [Achlya hypogyna]|uniref:Methylosome protein 50 n=1 Tax=Achlya hypogyna TaxID=1202772 RepID=A0A1V9ZJE3_ACHHY|nr:methylosome protein 50 [Achlya hypogyna]